MFNSLWQLGSLSMLLAVATAPVAADHAPITEHAEDIITLLAWMVVVIGGGLLGMLVWIGLRIQSRVDEIPGIVHTKMDAIRDDVTGDMREMYRDFQNRLDKMDDSVVSLDRRVTRLEAVSTHGKYTTNP